jgi:HD-GYP domain-containing protein (c-di-GMP phosphodiesterase class II)
MKIFSVSDLKVGMELASDVLSDIGITFLSKGTRLSQGHIDSFLRMGVDFVYINDASKAENKAERKDYYLIALNEFKKIYMGSRIGTSIDHVDYKGIMNGLFNQYANSNDVLGKIRALDIEDLYIYKHAVNVAVLSMCVGRWLRFSKNEIIDLGVAGYLHDIGKCNVPGNILNKPDRLTAEEYELMKTHASHSYELTKCLQQVSNKASEGILFHHERLDGSGYPNSARGSEIPLYGRILGVVDIFDAILSDRIYSAKVSPYKAIEILKDESFGKLDPKVVNILIKNIADFYVGNIVKLSTGEVGEVILLNKSNLTRPLIKVSDDRYLDLSTNYDVEISEVVSSEKKVRQAF